MCPRCAASFHRRRRRQFSSLSNSISHKPLKGASSARREGRLNSQFFLIRDSLGLAVGALCEEGTEKAGWAGFRKPAEADQLSLFFSFFFFFSPKRDAGPGYE